MSYAATHKLSYSYNLNGPLRKVYLNDIFVTDDCCAHRFNLPLYKDNTPASFTSGATVRGYFIRYRDNTTVLIEGELSGNVASVKLPKACYTQNGRFALIVKLMEGDVISTIFCGEGSVMMANTGNILDPDSLVPSLDDLLAKIADMEAATAEATTATETANTAAANADAAREAIADDLGLLHKLKADAIVCDASGSVISVDDASNLPLRGLTVYGKTTQDGTPTPDAPVPLVSAGDGGSIVVSVGENTSDTAPQTLTISTPNGLPGVPVTSGGNYTDENGLMWICDEVDLEREVYVQRVYQYSFTGSEAMNTYDNGSSSGNRLENIGLPECKILNPNSSANQTPAMCTVCEVGTQYQVNEGTVGLCFASWSNKSYFYFGAAIFGNLNTLKVAMAAAYADGNPYQIMYPLATPVEIALSDAEIAAYKAMHTNAPNTTVYNDAGAGMAVSYVADTKRYIDSKVSELVTLALANQ